MADPKTGILALAQKRISRTKTKVLQNLGKAERTTDDILDEHVVRVEKQQEVAHHLQKELKTYVHCLREMSQASNSLAAVLAETYELDWTKEPIFKTKLQTLDLMWNDYVQKIQDSVINPIQAYLQSFPVLKNKVAKRGRKMVDYDNSRHHLESLQAAKKRDDIKIQKAQEEMREAKRIYEELNNELRTELPDFHNSRVTFYADLLASLFGAGCIFHSEVGKVNGLLGDICHELQKNYEHFKYQPKRSLSKSISSSLDENGVSDEVASARSLTAPTVSSSASSIPPTDASPTYSNQDITENTQSASQSPPQLNGVSPDTVASRQPSYALTDSKVKKVDANSNNELEDETQAGHKIMSHNVYEEPTETSAAQVTSIGQDAHHSPEGSSEDGSDNDEGPIYSSPPSNQSLVSPPSGTLYTVQATHKYTGEDVDELSFEAGEIIYVIEFYDPEEQDEGWQMGVRASDGVEGVFPENFTRRL